VSLIFSISFILFLSSRVVYAEKAEIFVQMGHTNWVYAVAFSPDGRYVISSSGDHTLKLWEISTSRVIRTYKGHADFVTSVAFSPDGRYAVSGSGGPTNAVKLWEINTGREVWSSEGHSWEGTPVAYSPDGKYVLSAGKNCMIILREAATGKEVRTFAGHTRRIDSMAVSPDGRHLVSSSTDNTLRFWDVATGSEIRRHTFDERTIGSAYSLAFSPDSRYAAATLGYHISLWDVSTATIVRTFTGHSDNVRSVSFSSDGKYLLSSSADKTVKLWDVSTGMEIRTFIGHTDRVNSAGFSPDARVIISGSNDDTIKLWETSTGKEIKTFKGDLHYVFSVAFSPDGKYALSGNSDHILELWDITAGKLIRTFKGHTDTVTSVAYSPDSRYALSGSKDNTVMVWDVNTGREVYTFTGHTNSVTSVAFSPDGRYALSGSLDTSVKVWDVITGRAVGTLERPPVFVSEINAVAFTPDSRYAVAGGKDEMIRLWEVSTGRGIGERYFKGSQRITSITISPDGRYILLGSWDKTLKLMDRGTGRTIRTFAGHADWVNSVAFSPDGRFALSGGRDNAIKLWDVNTGSEVRTYKGHSYSTESVSFSPDGRYILSGSRDGTIIFWDMATGREVATLVSFSDGEWVIITPEGYFNASSNGAKHLNARVGSSVYSVDQFYNTFYRPEIVQLALTGKELPKIESLGNIASKKPAPTVEILSPRSDIAVPDDTVKITLNVKDNGGGIGNINIYLNGVQVANDTRGVSVKGKVSANEKLLDFNIPLGEGSNEIKVTALNANGSMESIPATINVISKAKPRKPSLYAIVVGINEYKNKSISLKYAVSDAKAFAETLKTAAKPLFENVQIKLLTTLNETTKESIRNAFDAMWAKVRPNDLFVFYNASHGVIDVVDEAEQYYLLTSNVLLLSSRHIGKDALSQKELIQLIGIMPAQKKLIILDTCHAGKAGKEITIALLQQTRGLTESTAVKILQRAIGSAVFSASSETQQALEGYRGHWLFTYVLLEGLKGGADMDKDGYIKIGELQDYVEERVVNLSEQVFKRQQLPNIQTGVNFPLGKIR
jgi:WD40 repeat protein